LPTSLPGFISARTDQPQFNLIGKADHRVAVACHEVLFLVIKSDSASGLTASNTVQCSTFAVVCVFNGNFWEWAVA
jgi:hypothetical protein